MAPATILKAGPQKSKIIFQWWHLSKAFEASFRTPLLLLPAGKIPTPSKGKRNPTTSKKQWQLSDQILSWSLPREEDYDPLTIFAREIWAAQGCIGYVAEFCEDHA